MMTIVPKFLHPSQLHPIRDIPAYTATQQNHNMPVRGVVSILYSQRVLAGQATRHSTVPRHCCPHTALLKCAKFKRKSTALGCAAGD